MRLLVLLLPLCLLLSPCLAAEDEPGPDDTPGDLEGAEDEDADEPRG